MTAKLSLVELPAEILAMICGELCLHCRGRQRHEYIVGVPEKAALEAREDKRALARLSRVCKVLRAAAQPVVFHYFHSGNQPRMISRLRWDMTRFRVSTAEDDLLLPFLRSLVERPDLASEVKALSLYYSECHRGAREESLAALAEASMRLGMDMLAHYIKRYPQELAIALCPRLEQLLTSQSGRSTFEDLATFAGQLPALEYIAAVVSVDNETSPNEYHFQGLRRLLVRAPNLRVLEAADCGRNSDLDERFCFDRSAFGIPLPQLRRLSVSSLSPLYIRKVLRHCPALEDLEAWISDEDDQDDPCGLDNDDLLPVRGTLRRLCYAVASPKVYSAQWRSEKTASYTCYTALTIDPFLSPRQATTILSFADFPRLEILELEQALLYDRTGLFPAAERAERFAREALSGPATFMAKLPPALRVLHVGLVVLWDELYRDLSGLAAAAPERFPALRTVRLDCYAPPPEPHARDLDVAFRMAGIELVIAGVLISDSARGMLGDRPGCPVTVQEPGFLFSL